MPATRNAVPEAVSTCASTVQPSDFYPYSAATIGEKGWSAAVLAYVAHAAGDQPVTICTDNATGHTQTGVLLGAVTPAFSGQWEVLVTYRYGTGPADFQRTRHLAFKCGTIIGPSSLKYKALGMLQKGASDARAAAQAITAWWDALPRTPYGDPAGKVEAKPLPQLGRWTVTFDPYKAPHAYAVDGARFSYVEVGVTVPEVTP